MKVIQFKNNKGVPVKNQFIIYQEVPKGEMETFQSYDSIIAQKVYQGRDCKVALDEKYWNYSKTTSKYRNQFLGETKDETEKKIKSGEYILIDLNHENESQSGCLHKQWTNGICDKCGYDLN